MRKDSQPNKSSEQAYDRPAKYRHLKIPQKVVSRTSSPDLMLWSDANAGVYTHGGIQQKKVTKGNN